MVLRLLSAGLYQRSLERKDHDRPSFEHSLRRQHRQSIFISSKPLRLHPTFSLLMYARCLVGTQLHMTPVPPSMVLTRQCSGPTTLASAQKKIVTSCQMRSKMVASGASTGSKTHPTQRTSARSLTELLSNVTQRQFQTCALSIRTHGEDTMHSRR